MSMKASLELNVQLEYIPLYQRKGEKPFLLEGGSMLLLAN
jgi:hypothetical protein